MEKKDWKAQLSGIEEITRRKSYAEISKIRVMEELVDLMKEIQTFETQIAIYNKNIRDFGLEAEDLRAIDAEEKLGVHALQKALNPWIKAMPQIDLALKTLRKMLDYVENYGSDGIDYDDDDDDVIHF